MLATMAGNHGRCDEETFYRDAGDSVHLQEGFAVLLVIWCEKRCRDGAEKKQLGRNETGGQCLHGLMVALVTQPRVVCIDGVNHRDEVHSFCSR